MESWSVRAVDRRREQQRRPRSLKQSEEGLAQREHSSRGQAAIIAVASLSSRLPLEPPSGVPRLSHQRVVASRALTWRGAVACPLAPPNAASAPTRIHRAHPELFVCVSGSRDSQPFRVLACVRATVPSPRSRRVKCVGTACSRTCRVRFSRWASRWRVWGAWRSYSAPRPRGWPLPSLPRVPRAFFSPAFPVARGSACRQRRLCPGVVRPCAVVTSPARAVPPLPAHSPSSVASCSPNRLPLRQIL